MRASPWPSVESIGRITLGFAAKSGCVVIGSAPCTTPRRPTKYDEELRSALYVVVVPAGFDDEWAIIGNCQK